MVPFKVDNGSAGYAGMTSARPHEDVSYSTRDHATKHSPHKQRRGRSARERILWKRKHMWSTVKAAIGWQAPACRSTPSFMPFGRGRPPKVSPSPFLYSHWSKSTVLLHTISPIAT